LFQERILAAVGKGHQLAARPNVKLPELLGERMLMLKEGHSFRHDTLSIYSRARMPFLPMFETGQFSCGGTSAGRLISLS
jgi:DNA-binding transcriptional LysR family regulator